MTINLGRVAKFFVEFVLQSDDRIVVVERIAAGGRHDGGTESEERENLPKLTVGESFHGRWNCPFKHSYGSAREK